MTSTGELYSSDEYLKRNPTYHMEDAAWKAAHIATMLGKHGLRPSSVTEVGCGAGQILAELKKTLPTTTRFAGYDISDTAIAVARERSDKSTIFTTGDFTKIETPASDLVLCIDVFEHVPDYPGFLTALRGKGTYKLFHIPLELSVYKVVLPGRLLVSTERFGHIHFFNRETALHALTDAGYDIIDSFYTRPGIDQGTTLEARLGRIPLKLLCAISDAFTARLAGAHSLLVLTK